MRIWLNSLVHVFQNAFIFRKWGIVRVDNVGQGSGKRWLGYGVGHGFGCYWLPSPIQHLIVRIWNHRACKKHGHVDMGFGACQMCCHPLLEDEDMMRRLREEVGARWREHDGGVEE